MGSPNADRVRRMWDEVCDDPLPAPVAAALARELTAENAPSSDPAARAALAATLQAVAARMAREAGGAPPVLADRSFRRRLDAGTAQVGAWRLLDAVRPQLALLPWSYWVTIAALFVIGVAAVRWLPEWSAAGLIATVPLMGLVGLLYTLRASGAGVREWEQSCPVTPFQLALTRVVIVLALSSGVSLLGSLILVRQAVGLSLAALTVSWLAPLALIAGVYLLADVLAGGWAAGAAGAVVWFAYLAFTRGGQAGTSVAMSTERFVLSLQDAAGLVLGAALIAVALVLCSRRGAGRTHERRAA